MAERLDDDIFPSFELFEKPAWGDILITFTAGKRLISSMSFFFKRLQPFRESFGHRLGGSSSECLHRWRILRWRQRVPTKTTLVEGLALSPFECSFRPQQEQDSISLQAGEARECSAAASASTAQTRSASLWPRRSFELAKTPCQKHSRRRSTSRALAWHMPSRARRFDLEAAWAAVEGSQAIQTVLYGHGSSCRASLLVRQVLPFLP